MPEKLGNQRRQLHHGLGHDLAVSSLPANEPRALLNLRRQEWRCFCPMIARTTRSGRRMLTRRQPLFPGYVFVSLDPQRSRWRAVDSTFGVRSIVKCGDLPVPLPVGCIEALIRLSGEDGLVTFAASLTAGDAVRFLSGPFTGLIGRLEHLDGAGRVTILLDLLGRATAIRGYASDIITDRSLPQS